MKPSGGQTAPATRSGSTHLSQVGPVLVKRPYFLPYVAFRDFGDYCDVFGNLLAILFDVAYTGAGKTHPRLSAPGGHR